MTGEWLSHDLVILAAWLCSRTQIGSNAQARETFPWLLGVTRYYKLLADGESCGSSRLWETEPTYPPHSIGLSYFTGRDETGQSSL